MAIRTMGVRRHTMRVKPGQHLSQAGVSLARHVGEGLGPFERVVTSTLPRAFETAIAMGFAVDEQVEQLSTFGEDVEAELEWPAGFAEVARIVAQNRPSSHFAREQAALWRSIAEQLPEGGHGLIVTHGGIIELGAVGCLPGADHAQWGPYCDYCEGIRLDYDGNAFTDARILRVKRG